MFVLFILFYSIYCSIHTCKHDCKPLNRWAIETDSQILQREGGGGDVDVDVCINIEKRTYLFTLYKNQTKMFTSFSVLLWFVILKNKNGDCNRHYPLSPLPPPPPPPPPPIRQCSCIFRHVLKNQREIYSSRTLCF